MNAGDIIRQARTYDAGFVREHHPDAILRPYLSTYHRQLAAKVVQRDRRAISAEIVVALPLATFEDGAALEDPPGTPIQYHRLQDGDAVLANDRREELNLIPAGRRFGRVRFPAAYVRGTTTLHLVGEAQDWNGYSEIRLRYAPIPDDFTDNSVDSVLPDDALDPLSWKLAAYMAGRRPEAVVGNPGKIEALADEAEDWFLDTVQTRKPSKSKVRDRF